MYDLKGMEIIENYRIMEDGIQNVSSGIGKAELFLVYVYIAIDIGFGRIIMRYFLTE